MQDQQSQNNPTKIFLTWNNYSNLVDHLISKMDMSKYDTICGIPRGGMVLALIMSYKTNKPIITPVELDLYTQNLDKVLIVDDIIDSGKTMEQYIEKYTTAALFKSYRCPIETDYYAQLSCNWIVFPYECDDVEDTVSEVNLKNVNERHGKE